MAACKVVDTEVGNEGEDEMSLYQDRTKSRTVRIMMSFRLEETTGMSGHNDGSDWGGLCDHCERVRTACHAAGVENARGRAAWESGFLGAGTFESSLHARKKWARRDNMTTRTTKSGARRRRASGEEMIRTTTGIDTARTPTRSTVLVVITGPFS